MADIELVIKIPEEMYKWVYDVNRFDEDYGVGDFMDLIKNGTLLPKGHGRLIDADEVSKYVIIGNGDLKKCPTIIEADKEQKDESDKA